MFCSLFLNNLLITFFLLFCLTTLSTGIEPERIAQKGRNDDTNTKVDKVIDKEEPVILKLENKTITVTNNLTITEKPQEVITNISNTAILINSIKPQDSGALYRLFLVLLGICALTVVYVSYRFYRMRTGATRPTSVRKYGVLTQRTDIEMLPLPLDDDEDDDTVFDVGNHMSNR